MNTFKYQKISTDSMTVQLNVRFSEEFMKNMEEYAEKNGFLSLQELIRSAVRKEIQEVRPEYLEVLKNTNEFLSIEESKKLHKKLKNEKISV